MGASSRGWTSARRTAGQRDGKNRDIPAPGREPAWKEQVMAGITVGVDGSHGAQKALEWAMKEAAAHHAPLTALTVHEVASDGWSRHNIIPPAAAPELEKPRHAAEEAVTNSAGQLGESRPASVTIRAVNGIPAQV